MESRRKDDNVINVTLTNIPRKAPEQSVHHAFESGGGITYAKKHQVEVINAICCTKGGFKLVNVRNWCFSVARLEIDRLNKK